MSTFLQNIPGLGRLLGWGQEGKEEEAKTEVLSFPDYMLDPDAVVSLFTCHILGGSRVESSSVD